MGGFRIVITYALILLNILGALYAEAHLTALAGLELSIIALGTLFSFILMIALAVETRWSWSIGLIYFSFALANTIFLFAITRYTLPFLTAAFLNLLGFIISAVSMVADEENTESIDAPPVETYEEPSQPVETYDVPKKNSRVRRA